MSKRTLDVLTVAMAAALGTLAMVDTRWLEIFLVSIIALCILLLLVMLANRLSKQMAASVKKAQFDTSCIRCGQTVSDMEEHTRKVHA